jgi:hypothetical protein
MYCYENNSYRKFIFKLTAKNEPYKNCIYYFYFGFFFQFNNILNSEYSLKTSFLYVYLLSRTVVAKLFFPRAIKKQLFFLSRAIKKCILNFFLRKCKILQLYKKYCNIEDFRGPDIKWWRAVVWPPLV